MIDERDIKKLTKFFPSIFPPFTKNIYKQKFVRGRKLSGNSFIFNRIDGREIKKVYKFSPSILPPFTKNIYKQKLVRGRNFSAYPPVFL
ncbi:Uncharacterized protein dnm_009570 [Desulfonema magnum]|uniref:Uncharacterized protein n=1 Tax=Desulfonema magnum TaxID=45655 RepID=A0A975BGM5_9BACT|nr:Uncharacterized protein dnm_009570 [Desulfonema magnum]